MSKKNKGLVYRLVLERPVESYHEEEKLIMERDYMKPQRFVEFMNFSITPDEAIEIMAVVVKMRDLRR